MTMILIVGLIMVAIVLTAIYAVVFVILNKENSVQELPQAISRKRN